MSLTYLVFPHTNNQTFKTETFQVLSSIFISFRVKKAARHPCTYSEEKKYFFVFVSYMKLLSNY